MRLRSVGRIVVSSKAPTTSYGLLVVHQGSRQYDQARDTANRHVYAEAEAPVSMAARLESFRIVSRHLPSFSPLPSALKLHDDMTCRTPPAVCHTQASNVSAATLSLVTLVSLSSCSSPRA